MTNLLLSDEVVGPEREVVLEERRMRVENDPAAQLDEALQASLFARHPYGTPIIGWTHEIEDLSRDDALAYYKRFYTPENAILVVAGDVSADEVRRIAADTYGSIPARAAPPLRARPQEPPLRAERLVSLADEKVEQAAYERIFVVPSYATAAPGEAEALELLAHVLGGGPASILYERLVEDDKLAVSVGAYYLGSALDDTRFYLFATPAQGVEPAALDAAFDRELARFLENEVRRGGAAAGQDAHDRRRRLCAGQPGLARALVWGGARHGTFRRRRGELGRPHRRDPGERAARGRRQMARQAALRQRLSPAEAGRRVSRAFCSDENEKGQAQ